MCKKPLFDSSARLAELLIQDMIYAGAAATHKPEEIVDFAWSIAEVYERKVNQNLQGWSRWNKEQYSLAERNRERVRAAQTDCVYCGAPLDGTSHLDHIDPIKLGGSGEITNLVYACAQCNLSKNGQDFWVFLETKTKSVQSRIIRRLEKLDKQIPIAPLPTEKPA